MSAAVSVDGYLDDTAEQRLILSNSTDLDRVDQVRAQADAILVGATTVRRDNPRLTVRDPARQQWRVATGKPKQPTVVILTASGTLEPTLRVWQRSQPPIIYTTEAVATGLSERLRGQAEVVGLYVHSAGVDMGAVLDDLGRRGIQRLLVEGGGHVHTQLLSADLADELMLAVAPVLVGQPAAARFLNPAEFPGGVRRRMILAGVEQVGDVAVLHYVPRAPQPPVLDRRWLQRAVELAWRCPRSAQAFSVGAVVVGADGMELACGFSRETDPKVHAEEAALDKLRPDQPLAGATLYSTLEPCAQRATTGRVPCAQRILHSGIDRVVIAWREPAVFVAAPSGVAQLRAGGISVIEVPELSAAAMAMNRHLVPALGPGGQPSGSAPT